MYPTKSREKKCAAYVVWLEEVNVIRNKGKVVKMQSTPMSKPTHQTMDKNSL
jgi:hypothetical protein